MNATIYHNPDCGTSRNALALLRAAGAEPTVIEYLAAPPDRQTLAALIADAGLTVRGAMRIKGTPYKDLGLDDPALGDSQLIEHMLRHPILINRPFVVTGRGARLCRPSELVLDLLEPGFIADVNKEEGTPFLRDKRIAGDDPGLAAALLGAGLPADDLAQDGRTFYEYGALAGRLIGYGGFERYGQDVLLRSIVVSPADRGQGAGRNLLALLLRRAYDRGARQAWLLTETAAPFFERVGFKAVAREQAPQAILATRQAQSLCPVGATLMTRTITF
ncbi:MAG: arsenic resistance N-acetyltransferase ArsN2 [Bordetella sp.]|uniref:arsenic resistance N-acetyltransferase ArsN2 n=1 Tax=Bordetella sp. TaxID=28081 RepID=UPI003F7B5A35